MKTRNLFGLAVILAAAFVLAVTGVVAARGVQHGTPPFNPDADESQEEEGSWGFWHGMGWHHADQYDQPPVMDAMISALAENTSLTEDEINSSLSQGDHLYSIALAAGLTAEEFYDLMDSVHDQALADGEDGRDGYYPHMRFYGQTDEDESFTPPCHGFEKNEDSAYGDHPFGWGHGW